MKAAVQLERLTRVKGAGRQHPDLCIDEVLKIAGATRADVDVIAMSRTLLNTEYFRRMRGLRWLQETAFRRSRGKTLQYMTHEMRRYHSKDYDDLFDLAAFRRDGGFRPETVLHFSNHHEAHAVPTLFYSRGTKRCWLPPTAAAIRSITAIDSFRDGAIKTIYGGEECLFAQQPATVSAAPTVRRHWRSDSA